MVVYLVRDSVTDRHLESGIDRLYPVYGPLDYRREVRNGGRSGELTDPE